MCPWHWIMKNVRMTKEYAHNLFGVGVLFPFRGEIISPSNELRGWLLELLVFSFGFSY